MYIDFVRFVCVEACPRHEPRTTGDVVGHGEKPPRTRVMVTSEQGSAKLLVGLSRFRRHGAAEEREEQRERTRAALLHGIILQLNHLAALLTQRHSGLACTLCTTLSHRVMVQSQIGAVSHLAINTDQGRIELCACCLQHAMHEQKRSS
jgi:hypothetical protein